MPQKFRICALVLLSPSVMTPVLAQDEQLALEGHHHTIRECMEAGEFIMHAAQSRDNGKSGDVFKKKLEEDLFLIKTFPAYLRWFAYTPSDERFLRAWTKQVFSSHVDPTTLKKWATVGCQGVAPFPTTGDQPSPM